MEEKRLFLGFSVDAPWQETYPKGRVIEESSRHLTLAFLGNTSFEELKKKLNEDFPKPEFSIGPVGMCNEILFLPKMKPRVVAVQVDWISDGNVLENYHKKILDWLEELNFSVDRRPLLPHITLARGPFVEKEWEDTFEPFPAIITGIHLFESMGNLRYASLWNIPLTPAFEEFEHTADIAFQIKGENIQQLYIHGALAMSFKYPPFFSYLEQKEIKGLNDIVQTLNRMLARCDQEIGCPFKAVSYHGKIEEKKLLEWEMIVDV